MNDFNDIPLTLEEGDELTATLAHWCEPAKRGGGFSLAACGYGAVLMVNGEPVRTIWGAGYAKDATPVLALAVARILRMADSAVGTITVYAINEFARYWGPSGIVADSRGRSGWTRNGGKLAIWPTMRDLQAAYEAKRWQFRGCEDKWSAPWFAKAGPIAVGIAKKAGLGHKAKFAPTFVDYPDAVILEGGTV